MVGGKKCFGVLLISGFKVEYRSSDGECTFSAEFTSLKLTVKDDELDFEGKEKHKFRVQDAKQGAEIKALWDKLKKLVK
jgi:hypothetical protein